MLTHPSETILGDIPKDWDRELLSNLLAEQQGGDWGDDTGDAEIKVLRSTNFTNGGTLDVADVASRYFTSDKAAKFGLTKRDLLLERSGGSPTQPVGRLGFIAQDLPQHWFSNFVQLLRPASDKIHPQFLGWVLLQLHQSGIVERLQHQTTQMRNLDFRDYLRVYLPKPPSNEQKKIALILQTTNDALSAVHAKLSAAIRVKIALLQQLFTSGIPGRHQELRHTRWFKAPEAWIPQTLRQVAEVEAGFTMGRDLSGNETVEVSYLTVVNVQEGGFDLGDVSSVLVKKSELDGLLLKPGDVLMTEGGDRDKLGRGGMWRGEIHPCVYQNHIFRVRLKPGTYNPELFHYLLQTWHAKNYFFAHAKQTSNLCTINSRELKRLPLFEPSPDEQEEMITLLDAADAGINAVKDEITALSRLRRSLLQHLLTGEVRVAA
jgi:type I restriction enzyme S subunit